MKKKILWLMLSWLIVAALVLASCGEAAPGEQEEEEEEEEEEPVVGEPQYGGTLTFADRYLYEPRNWDATTGAWMASVHFYPYLSFLVLGDVEKYGPRGTNDYAFCLHQEIPDQYLGGDLAESWEVSEEGLVFHLREGCMYTGNDRIGMEAREVTAEDVVIGLEHIMEGPLGAGASKFVEDIYAEGRYTVVIDFKYYEFLWGPMLIFGMGSVLYPPEVIEAGAENWRNQCGSGPFILKEYVTGSASTYVRNPDHWGTTTIDGVEYETPFIDELVLPIMPDELTAIAALRTAKIDLMGVAVRHVESLADTTPELIIHKYVSGGMVCVSPQIAHGIFADHDVRRALMVGIDMQAYVDSVLMGEGLIHPFPSPGSPYYTPLDELPPETRLLFEYDPDLAMDMLADAGYPDGFKVTMHMKPSNVRDADCAAFLVDQWAKIGVDVELNGLEQTVHEALRFNREFEGIYLRDDALGATTELAQRKTEAANLACSWNDAYFDEQLSIAQRTVDIEERTRILKEMAVYFIDDVGNINLPAGMNYKYWWPWLKNYYGEEDMGYANSVPVIVRMWIDEDLKDEMGY